jgi:hypothetical protein
MKFKGLVEISNVRKDGSRYNIREYPNLLVDDGKEYILDFLAGIKSWHKPAATGSGVVGLMTFERFGAVGLSMFNNSSVDRAAGRDGILTGIQCNYPIASTILVSPEDSTLSNEVGTRIQLTATRRDQTVEFVGRFEVPGNLASGTQIREFGLFLQSTGPTSDPSLIEDQKNRTMLCRTSLWGSGVCAGPIPIYTDRPLTANDDVEIRWKFGEL